MLEGEAKKIKANMIEVAKKQVEEEHKAGELRLQNALKKAREEFEKEKEAAVARARQQEQNYSMDKINALMKQQEENIAKLKLEAEFTKKVSKCGFFARFLAFTIERSWAPTTSEAQALSTSP